MKNKKFSTRVLAEMALFTAIAFALDVFQSGLFRGIWTNGGSVGIAMVPIFILCFKRGFLPGLISGFALSFLQMLGGVYAIADKWYMVLLQISLDYILAYPVIAAAGLLYSAYQNANTNTKKLLVLNIGIVVGGLLKLLCHFLAGVIFWSSSTPEGFLGGPIVYSLVYNGSFMIINILLACAIMSVISLKYPNLLKKEDVVNE